jgi:ATP phosphoribosyltransferase regulatory subunit
VARDIIKRPQSAALEYARQMNYRYMAVVAGENHDIELISLGDGESRSVSWQQLEQDAFEL